MKEEELSPYHEIFENNLRAINDNKNRNDLIVAWFRQSMKAYAEQEKQKAVVEFAKEYVFPLMDLSNFVAENLKDNPWCTVYNLQEQNEKIEKHLGIKPDYTPTKYED